MDYASGGLGRAEEGLGGHHVPVFAQHGVSQVAVAIDDAVEITQVAADFQIGLVNVPRAPSGSALAATSLPEFRLRPSRVRR
jgi:hypothetical protein